MQTAASVKKNRYKFAVGEYAWVIPDQEDGDEGDEKILVKVAKRLLRPYRESQNFYLCEHCDVPRKFTRVHYEGQMEKIPDEGEYYTYPLV